MPVPATLPSVHQPSVHQRGETATSRNQTRIASLGNGEVFQQALANRFDIRLMPGSHEVQQTVERILNLTADHIDIGHGKLRFHIVGAIGRGGAHITHVGGGGTRQQQAASASFGSASSTCAYAAAAPA